MLRIGVGIAIFILLDITAAQAKPETVAQFVNRFGNNEVGRSIVGEVGDGFPPLAACASSANS